MMEEHQELSAREIEILQLVARGASNKEIAQRLFISTNTVKVHLRNIFGKIGVSSRTEAAMYAVSNRMIPELRLEEAEPPQTIAQPVVQDAHIERFWNTKPHWFWLLIASGGVLLFIGAIFLIRTMRAPSAQPIPSAFEPPTWQKLTPMPTVRAHFAVVALEDYIYAIAGENETGIIGAVERYDLKRDRWRRMAEKPTPVSEVQAAVIGGKIYVPGGLLADGTATRIMEVYLPQEDRWTQAADLPQEVSAYALVAYEGKLYLFGGRDGNSYLKSVYLYDADLNLWQRLGDMPAPRAFASAVVASGKIHLLGGWDGHASLDAHDIYSPGAEGTAIHAWEAVPPLPQRRYKMAAVSVADAMYLLGGASEEMQAMEAWMYLPQANSWQPFLNPLESAWEGLSAVAVGTKIYALGGVVAGEFHADLFAYQVIYITVLPIVR